MANALNWFEIPVTDFARAKIFYEKVLGIVIDTMEMGPVTMGMLSRRRGNRARRWGLTIQDRHARLPQ